MEATAQIDSSTSGKRRAPEIKTGSMIGKYKRLIYCIYMTNNGYNRQIDQQRINGWKREESLAYRKELSETS